MLRIAANGAPTTAPAASSWQHGLGPVRRVARPGDALRAVAAPASAGRDRGAPPSAVSPRPFAGSGPVSSAVAAAAPVVAPAAALARTAVVATVPVVSALPVGGAAAPAAAAAATLAASPNAVVQKVLSIVAEKTGYPPEMLDMDLDLEADLGVDTVKQAETFAAVREAYGIARQENLKLRDFPTLKHVVEFVYQFRPDLKPVSAPTAGAPGVAASLAERRADGTHSLAPADPRRATVGAPALAAVAASASDAAPASAATAASNPVVQKVLEIVAEKTGYPPDMLEMDLDLEADLGVDTVKQAETFAAVREAYGIARQENLKLRDFPTLKHVVEFVYQFRPDLKPWRRRQWRAAARA